MYHFKSGLLILIHLLISIIFCSSSQFNDHDLKLNHISQFYNDQNFNKKLVSSGSSNNKLSILRKFKPSLRRNNPQTSFINHNLVFNDQQSVPLFNSSNSSQFTESHISISQPNSSAESTQNHNPIKLIKSKIKVQFVNTYEDNKISNEINQNHNDEISNSISDSTNDPYNDSSLTYAQKTILAFEHGLKIKREARCESPKPTIVYLNHQNNLNKREIKIYLPRATILHRCGQNTGCCDSESEECIAIEQKQINLSFFVMHVIKMDKEYDESDNKFRSSRKGRKYAIDLDDNSILKEYEYNLDYTINDNENLIKLNGLDGKEMLNGMLKNENDYLNSLLNQDNIIKRRLSRSIRNRRTKEFDLDSPFSTSIDYNLTSFNTKDITSEVGNRIFGGESNLNRMETTSESRRINSKKPYTNFFDTNHSSNQHFNNRISSFKNHIRRSLDRQIKPKQTIEMLTFTNHTKCGCVNRL